MDTGVGAIGADVATVAIIEGGVDAGADADTEAVTEEAGDVTAPTAAPGVETTGFDAADLRAGPSGVWLTIVHFAPAGRLLT